MVNDNNLKWTKKNIAEQYKLENPSWSWNECWKRAKIVYKELNRLNREQFKNRDKFFRHNTPFSFFDNKDSEFEDIPWCGKNK